MAKKNRLRGKRVVLLNEARAYGATGFCKSKRSLAVAGGDP